MQENEQIKFVENQVCFDKFSEVFAEYFQSFP